MTTQFILLIGYFVRIQEDVVFGANIVVRQAESFIEVENIKGLRLLKMLTRTFNSGFDPLHEVCPFLRHHRLLHACSVVKPISGRSP